MRWLALGALLAISVLTTGCNEAEAAGFRCRISRNGSRSGSCADWSPVAASGDPAVLFRLAGPAGAGMPAACSSTAVTTAGGAAVTCTRAGTRYCTKGNETTGIVAGDLVELAADTCVVMPGGDGTGGLGIGAWNAYTNSSLQSQTIGTAPWDTDAAGVAVPSLTQNYGSVADPEGNHKGSRYVIPATTAADYSIFRQLGSCPFTATMSQGIYIIGTSGSGTIDMCAAGVGNGTGTPAAVGGFGCVPCSYNNTTWTRCTRLNASQGGAGNAFFGNASLLNGGTARAAADFVVWQHDCTIGDLGPPIKTVGVATASLPEVNTSTVSLSAATNTFAATWVTPATIASDALLHIYKDANNSTKLSIASGKVRSTFRIGGSDSTRDTTASATASAVNVTAGYYDGTNRAACLAGSCQTTAGALTLPTGAHTVYIGSDQAGVNQVDGVVKRICIDPTGCPP